MGIRDLSCLGLPGLSPDVDRLQHWGGLFQQGPLSIFTADSDVWVGFALLPVLLIFFFLCFDGQKGEANSRLI